jgi:hypothetical protein
MADSKHTYWSNQFESLMAEMSRLCTVCDISMLEPGTADRVLNGDESVCGRKNPPGRKAEKNNNYQPDTLTKVLSETAR